MNALVLRATNGNTVSVSLDGESVILSASVTAKNGENITIQSQFDALSAQQIADAMSSFVRQLTQPSASGAGV